MKQEDKQLLLQDLSSRLPHGVILSVGIFDNGDIKYHNKKLDYHSNLLSLIELDGGYYFNGLLCKYPQFTAKPYLRPLSSMTDKEREEYRKFSYYGAAGIRDNDFTEMVAVPSFEKLDFLNSNHFDYRGLIPKGLAIAVTKDNNPYK